MMSLDSRKVKFAAIIVKPEDPGNQRVSDLFFCLARATDPIFSLATPLQPEEEDSSSREVIAPPHQLEDRSSVSGQQTAAVQGGWFGRGYGKGRKKKKAA